jgi:hypothetical protein
MTTPKQIHSPSAPDAYKPPTPTEKLEEDASLAAVVSGGVLRAMKVAAVVFLGLLVCPPLAIFVFLIIAPLLVIAVVLGLLAAVLSMPYLLVHYLRGEHGDHLSMLAHRLRRAGRALIDLAPHRIVADARKLHSGR